MRGPVDKITKAILPAVPAHVNYVNENFQNNFSAKGLGENLVPTRRG